MAISKQDTYSWMCEKILGHPLRTQSSRTIEDMADTTILVLRNNMNRVQARNKFFEKQKGLTHSLPEGIGGI